MHRLNALRKYHIMDTEAEADFDEITQIASQLCGTPISLVSLLDDRRQWFKSHLGLEGSETPRDQAFCAHAIERPEEIMVVDNPVSDPRFHDNPLVTGDPTIRFYAGAPLVTPEGYALGTLCVISQKPHSLTEAQLRALKALANQVMAQMELRKKVYELEAANQDVNEYAHIVSHDLKSPLNTLASLVGLLRSTQEARLDDKGRELMEMMELRIDHLKGLIEGILNYSLLERREELLGWVDMNELLPQILADLSPDEHVTIRLQSYYPSLWINKTHAEQIFQNLLTNAIKYSDKEKTLITIESRPLDHRRWEFTVADNGRGINEQFFDQVFEPFKTLQAKDRFGEAGTGIGLATVKKLIVRDGGDIRVESTPGQGSQFILTLVGKATAGAPDDKAREG